ncbi:MAG: YgiQ family radical SAM protein [Methanomicrobiales archaeon]|nr:YgiQ family radical SAM protein [Methanomicrobiales archaeon]NYT21401.1 YgiQ family radical SAM protein [Methanomicrobiales archaeon]
MTLPQPGFLPVSKEEAQELGIEAFDIIIVSGDAYVDHPLFAAGLLGRVLWEEGYTVGILPQPDWTNPDEFRVLGSPRLFFAVSAGNVDSLVNHYTPQKKPRSGDVYSPGGRRRRPDRATLVYTDLLHALFPGTPIVIGGIEASLRRFAHYDYWSDRVRQSILADAPADILVFGMGERPLGEIAARLSRGDPIMECSGIPGTVVRIPVHSPPVQEDSVILPSFSEVSKDKKAFARAFSLISAEQDPFRGRPLVQPHPKSIIIQNPPARPISTAELDHIYELPFSRRAHPSYREPVPALEPVRFSVVSHRGCFGNCAFCALSLHQGCIIRSRSVPSVVREVTRMTRMPGWKGIVQDIGGPTANMFGMSCSRWREYGTCPDRACGPGCPRLEGDLGSYLDLLRAVRKIPGVRKVFVGSGLRYDLIGEEDEGFLAEFCSHHVSGHLKVAPEHITRTVTDLMHKPPGEVFESFRKRFEHMQSGKEKRQYLLPYLMSGHPGCTIRDMVELAEYIRDTGLYTEQVQDFTPTPMTASTCMYYTGIQPDTGQQIHVPKGREKRVQRAILQYRDRKNRDLIEEGLRTAGREDLIGTAWVCLIPPGRKGKGKSEKKQAGRRTSR